MSHNIHFLTRLILKNLPKDASILCIGVGTGLEIAALAQAFPGWTFDGIDPSAAMLDTCKKRLEREDISNRCDLFHGYLSEFKTAKKYDAGLCLLVMHFVKDQNERAKMFSDMAMHLKSGGYLINAEISYDTSCTDFLDILEKWKAMQLLSGATQENVDKIQKTMEEHLAVIPPSATEKLMREAGFGVPIQFFQSLLIYAWYAQKR